MKNEKSAGAVSLKVMAERKVEGISKVTKFNVDPRLVEIEAGFNVRPIDRDHVESIKSSIRAGETMPDLVVRVDSGRIILIGGHHRRTAYLELIAEGAQIVSVGAEQFRGNDADRVIHMLTSAQGMPNTPLQQGVLYRRLIAFGWSAAQIHEKTGKSMTHIHSNITLAESNSDVQQMVTSKQVAAHVALKMVRKHGEQAGTALVDHMNTARLSGKQKVTEKTIDNGSPKSFIRAIEADMASGGTFKAEVACPKYAHLIAYLRASTVALAA